MRVSSVLAGSIDHDLGDEPQRLGFQLSRTTDDANGRLEWFTDTDSSTSDGNNET